jgi:hypothetical protein
LQIALRQQQVELNVVDPPGGREKKLGKMMAAHREQRRLTSHNGGSVAPIRRCAIATALRASGTPAAGCHADRQLLAATTKNGYSRQNRLRILLAQRAVPRQHLRAAGMFGQSWLSA